MPDTADAALVERYLEYVRCEKRLATRTLELYALNLHKLLTLADALPVALQQVGQHHVRRWVMQMHHAGHNGRGIALTLSSWRGFYAWWGRQGGVASNPVQDVRAPKSAKLLPKALAVDEAVQFADFYGDDNPWLEARDAAMVELLYSSGLRVSELVGLDVVPGRTARGWVDTQAAQVHVLGKGNKWRIVPVGRAALEALAHWQSVRDEVQSEPLVAHEGEAHANRGTVALFIGRNGLRLTAQSVWKRLKRRSAQAGLSTPVHPHMLRHSCASHMLQSSGDLRAVQELLGHATISTTQVYTRLDFQHLAQAYDAAHPRAKLQKKV